MIRRGLIALLVGGVSIVACGPGTPPPAPTPSPPPAPAPSPGPERITGSERIGWNQPAGDAAELAAFRYAIYVDGVRSVLDAASCEATATQAGFACSAKLPAMSPGQHALELAAFVLDGGTEVEGARSVALQVIVATTVAAAPAPWSNAAAITTIDRVRLRLELVADGLDRPADLAFTQDGRILVAERAGRVRVVRDGHLLADPALELRDVSTAGDGGLLALAIDPDFSRTGFVYALYTTSTTSGALAFRLARFREAGGALAERAILLDGVPASADRAAAALRFGPDRLLYVALDDGGEVRRSGDLASFNGKLLRLTPDGTTPADQVPATPVRASGFRSPRGLAWHPGTGTLWIADEDGPDRASLRAMGMGQSVARRGTIDPTYALPTDASGLAFYAGDRIPAFRNQLFVAADEGRDLVRLHLDPQHPQRVESAERLLDRRVGGVRAVAVGPDGAIYFCTNVALARLVPE